MFFGNFLKGEYICLLAFKGLGDSFDLLTKSLKP